MVFVDLRSKEFIAMRLLYWRSSNLNVRFLLFVQHA